MVIRILRVHLENYRSFRGEHSFNLETSPGKHVALIYGPNSSGKSTITEAIQLCLYGNEDFENMEPLISHSLIDETEKGGRVSGQVAVTIENKRGEQYRVSRDIHVVNTRRGPQDDIGDLAVEKKTENETWETIETPYDIVESIFPPSSEVLAFPGFEQVVGLDAWGSSTSNRELVQAVQATYPEIGQNTPNVDTINNKLKEAFSDYLNLAERFLFTGVEFDFSGEYLEVRDKEQGEKVTEKLSTGNSTIISIMLILAAGDVAAKKFPLVLDIPFGRLDGQGRRIVREMFRLAGPRQLILTTTDFSADEIQKSDFGERIAVSHELEYVPAKRA